MKRQYDPNTGFPLPTKEEWHAGVTSEDLEDIAIMKTAGIVVGIVVFIVILILLCVL